MLGPVSSHTAAETRQVVATLGSQPTVAGHSGDHPPDLETLRATPARPHQILIQGNMCARRGSSTAISGGPMLERGPASWLRFMTSGTRCIRRSELDVSEALKIP